MPVILNLHACGIYGNTCLADDMFMMGVWSGNNGPAMPCYRVLLSFTLRDTHETKQAAARCAETHPIGRRYT